MQVDQQITINVSADKLWNILGANFNDVSKWAVRMLESTGRDDLGPKGGRIVQTIEYGEAQEILYLFDAGQRTLAYRVEAKGLPPILQDVTTGWRIEPQGDDISVVHISFGAKLLNEEMAGPLSVRLKDGLDQLLPQLKHYAENDQPHPDKQAQLNAQESD